MRGTATTKDLVPGSEQIRRSRLQHVHHGRTPAAWVGTIGVAVGFLIGSISLIIPDLTGMFVGLGVVVLAILATLVLRMIGYGAD